MNRTRTIVIAFSTLDGIVEDPDGRGETPNGGWAFRHGPEAVAGDKFRLGSLLDTGSLLMGRKTWQQFSRLWPGRTDDFSAAMNRIPKLVVSRTVSDLIMVFPELVGRGTKLFTTRTAPTQLRLRSANVVGPSVLMRYERIGQS